MERPNTRREAYVSRRSRKKRRKQKMTGLLVLMVVVGLLFLVAFLLLRGRGKAEDPASVPAVSVPAPAVSAAASVPVQAEEPAIPAASGALDVEGIPPLYNRNNPVPQNEHGDNIELGEAGGGYTMEPRAAEAFRAMFDAAAKEGITLTPVSGYRSNQRQTDNYNGAYQRYIDQGMSQAEATRLTELYYAIPGTSEHEAGLAMDIGSVEDSFANTPAYAWLQEHAHEYGFIYRYPGGTRKSDGKSYTDELTFIAWEPWHYRFVGQNHAEKIKALSAGLPEDDVLTLEEYVAYLKGEEVPVLEMGEDMGAIQADGGASGASSSSVGVSSYTMG